MSHRQLADANRNVETHISNWESNLEKDFCILTFYFSNNNFSIARVFLERILNVDRDRDNKMWDSLIEDLGDQILKVELDPSSNKHLISDYKSLQAQANQHLQHKTDLYSIMLEQLEEMQFGNGKFWIKLQFSILLWKIQKHMVRVFVEK
jgi:hypothetical protein